LLRRAYGEQRWTPSRPPLDGLIRVILSQHTTRANASLAFDRLRARFRTWEEAAAARAREIERCIRCGGLSRQKSGRILQILRRLQGEGKRCRLQGLKKKSTSEALNYLMELPGVGLKTAACVLLFYLNRPVFAVDTHVHRITRRLGWVPPRYSPEDACRALDPLIPNELKYSLHVNLIAHGRQVCRARRPRCDLCVIERYCDKVGL